MVGSSAAQKADEAGRNSQKERLGGARADFVANLGRRRTEITGALNLVREEPNSSRHRDDLRRRVHALAAGAKLLRFTALADELRRVEERFDEASKRGEVTGEDIDFAREIFSRMTSLAWGQTGEKPVITAGGAFARLSGPKLPEVPAPAPAPGVVPNSVLVVGAPSIEEALLLPSDGGDNVVFEVERTDEISVALDIAKAVAPDVIVIDGDLPGAIDLVEALTTNDLTDGQPIVVIARFGKTEDGARFAALGVAKTLPKPASPSEIRRACKAVLSTYVKREVVREPIGEVNVDQLGSRLAEELRRGLTDVEASIRDKKVDLGEGTEIMAALWGAVARIRDSVTIRSQGGLRFQGGGPEGAMPLAPWIGPGDSSSNGRAPWPSTVRARTEVSLNTSRILVADDDPAVNWFLAGVLKAAGAAVYEARDGERAFEIAKHCEPDLIITDILMPKLDGFALSRALKRDVVLRDVPVVLLSWKEDLLQRVRELGADVDGYMRKEASAGAVVQRVRELLRQRVRVAERIAEKGEVRGRLDGLTTATLLRMICKSRPNATVSVRDASFLYELEIRGGRPVRATRTSPTGTFERGLDVVGAFLGVGDGRFVVAPNREEEDVARVNPELDGSLTDQMIPVIARARAAQQLLSGSNLVRVERVVVDQGRLDAYLVATPEPARKVLRRVARGESPRALIVSGEVAPRLLEEVLGDAAVHGAVVEILDGEGQNRLPEATDHERALLRGEKAARPIASILALPIPSTAVGPAAPLSISMPAQAELFKAAMVQAPPAEIQAAVALNAFPRTTVSDLLIESQHPGKVITKAVAPSEELDRAAQLIEEEWLAGTEQVEDESPVAESGPRPLTPAPAQIQVQAQVPTQVQPEARRPELPRLETVNEHTPTPSELPPAPGLRPMLSLGSLHPPPVALIAEPKEAESPRPKKIRTPKPGSADARREAKAERETTPSAPFAGKNAVMLPSAFLPRVSEAVKPKDRKTLYWVLFALAGVGFAVWARWSREKTVSEDVLSPVSAASADPTAEASADSAPTLIEEPTSKAATKDKEKDDGAAPEVLPLRDFDKVKKGQGMLEVVAGKSDTIYIDGKPMGSGPLVTQALKARSDAYEVKVKMRGEERVRFVNVTENKLTRVRVAPPWAR